MESPHWGGPRQYEQTVHNEKVTGKSGSAVLREESWTAGSQGKDTSIGAPGLLQALCASQLT